MILSRSPKNYALFVLYLIVLGKNRWPSLSEIYFFHPPVFPAPRYNSVIACALFVVLLSLPSCLPACSYLCLPDVFHIFRASFLAFITSCTLSFHHQIFLYHGDLRPAILLTTSCPTLEIVVLLCSHHSCTLSTGLTFSNTVCLNVILELSSFNLHHFILAVACSGVQRFLPYLLLRMCQFRCPPTITLSPSSVALSS